jgi:hypothetical protein
MRPRGASDAVVAPARHGVVEQQGALVHPSTSPARSRPSLGVAGSVRCLLIAVCLLVGILPGGLLDAGAAAASPAMEVKNLSASPNESAWNRVAASGDHVHVVWQDRSYSSGGGGAVLYRRSTDRGTTWEAPRILSDRLFDAVHPAVAASGDAVHIAWHESTPFDPDLGSREVHVASSHDAGRSFRSVQVSDDAADSLDPSLAVVDGGVHVAWNDSEGRVLLASSGDGGATYTERVVARGARYGWPTKAAAVAGAVLVAYQGDRGVQLVRLKNRAQQADEPLVVEPAGSLDGLAAWGTGAHVVYRTTGGEQSRRTALHVTTSTDSGATFGPAEQLDTGVQDPYYESVDVVADGGQVGVLWGAAVSDAEPDAGGAVPGPRGVFAAVSQDGGRSWGPARTLATAPQSYVDVRLAVLDRSLPGTVPEPALTWRVPERFGHDADGDGMVDYVTTAEQLRSQTYPVTLDGCASTGGGQPGGAVRLERGGRAADLGRLHPRARVRAGGHARRRAHPHDRGRRQRVADLPRRRRGPARGLDRGLRRQRRGQPRPRAAGAAAVGPGRAVAGAALQPVGAGRPRTGRPAARAAGRADLRHLRAPGVLRRDDQRAGRRLRWPADAVRRDPARRPATAAAARPAATADRPSGRLGPDARRRPGVHRRQRPEVLHGHRGLHQVRLPDRCRRRRPGAAQGGAAGPVRRARAAPGRAGARVADLPHRVLRPHAGRRGRT